MISPEKRTNMKKLLEKNGFNKMDKDPITGALSGYPEALRAFKIIYSSPSNSLENHYFYIVNFLQQVLKYPHIEKIIDVYTSSTLSSLFGNAMQKLGAQQDKATALMASIGRLVLDIFKNIYELRKIDERLGYFAAVEKGSASADVALKGVWADNVDSQSRNEASIMTLAQKANFVALPDLFYRTFVRKEEDIDEAVERWDLSESIKSVLKRKLLNFLRWSVEIQKELQIKRKLSLRMLRQHYNSVKLYSYWLRPYLVNIKNLQMYNDFSNSPDIINSFEGNVSEIEILAKKKNGDKNSVILANFFYRTHPFMQTGQDYSRYPVHVGRLELSLKAYLWNDEDIEKYKKLRDQETFELIDEIGTNINDTLMNLGDDLDKYLKEAEGVKDDEEESGKKDNRKEKLKEYEKVSVAGLIEPFTALFDGLKELGSAIFPSSNGSKAKTKGKSADKSSVVKDIWLIYKLYKKVHKFPTF